MRTRTLIGTKLYYTSPLKSTSRKAISLLALGFLPKYSHPLFSFCVIYGGHK